MSLLDEVTEIVATALNVDPEVITPQTSQETLANWDSLAQITLITALESKYDVEFEIEEIVEVNTVQAILDHLRESGIG